MSGSPGQATPTSGARRVRSVTFSFLLALNFFRQSTVSCLCMQEATVDRCWGSGEEVREWKAGLPKGPSAGRLMGVVGILEN